MPLSLRHTVQLTFLVGTGDFGGDFGAGDLSSIAITLWLLAGYQGPSFG